LGKGTQRPNGRQRFRGAACPGATCLSRLARRFAFVLLALSKCRKPGVRRIILPVAVILKRLATDFLVFCMGKVSELRRRRRGRPNDVPRHRQSRAEPARCAGSDWSGPPVPGAGIPHKLAVSTLAVDRRTASNDPGAVLRARRARGRKKKGMHGLEDRVIDLNHLAHNSEGLPGHSPSYELTQPRQPPWTEYRTRKRALLTRERESRPGLRGAPADGSWQEGSHDGENRPPEPGGRASKIGQTAPPLSPCRLREFPSFSPHANFLSLSPTAPDGAPRGLPQSLGRRRTDPAARPARARRRRCHQRPHPEAGDGHAGVPQGPSDLRRPGGGHRHLRHRGRSDCGRFADHFDGRTQGDRGH
jgi:hypothetical protein